MIYFCIRTKDISDNRFLVKHGKYLPNPVNIKTVAFSLEVTLVFGAALKLSEP